jgi:hypothetical protein
VFEVKDLIAVYILGAFMIMMMHVVSTYYEEYSLAELAAIVLLWPLFWVLFLIFGIWSALKRFFK